MIRAAEELLSHAKALKAEIGATTDPPSRSRIEAVQGSLNQLQQHLNRI